MSNTSSTVHYKNFGRCYNDSMNIANRELLALAAKGDRVALVALADKLAEEASAAEILEVLELGQLVFGLQNRMEQAMKDASEKMKARRINPPTTS